MMVPERTGWVRTIFRYRGSELPRTKNRILGVLALSIAVTAIEKADPDVQVFDVHVVPFTLIGVALSIFLGFRNNAAYERWWEGRKLWGALVNTARTFARQAVTLIAPPPDASDEVKAEVVALERDLVHRAIAFFHTTRHALRDEPLGEDVARHLPADEYEALKKETNKPSAVTFGIAMRVRHAYDRGFIHPMHLPTLEQTLVALTDLHGGCERIKSTPIPFSYTTLIHRIVAVYCYTLPFGLITEIGFLTPIACLVVSYAFFGLDIVGDEIEQPFGHDPNDLPLTAISRMIEINLRQRLGDDPLPEPMKPVREVLS
jgi:putative membrane protein